MFSSRTDWWTWSDDLNATSNDQQLALDPACGELAAGERARPLVTDMLNLADARRSGQHPEYNSTWGEAIGSFPDLKTFELVLGTFSAKKHQLDTVVECARTWKFPLRDTRYELVHDNNVESLTWKDVADADGDHTDDSEQGRAQENLHNPEGAENTDQSRASGQSEDEIWHLRSHSETYTAYSCCYGWESSYRKFLDEPWIRNAHEFEVRIVRFRRRRID